MDKKKKQIIVASLVTSLLLVLLVMLYLGFTTEMVPNTIKFLRAAFTEKPNQDLANFMLTGASVGFYVFLGLLFYVMFSQILNRADLFDKRFHQDEAQEDMVIYVVKLLFINFFICLGLYTFYIIILAVIANMFFN